MNACHSLFWAAVLTTVEVGAGFILDSSGGTSLPPLAQPPLRIASFNIQVFGRTKYSDLKIRNTLVKILCRYDIVLVLEIRDATNTVFERLRQDVNHYLKTLGETDYFEKEVSQRLGRSSSKEQYGFLYRPSRVNLTSTYQFVDTHDVFEREPFGVLFSSPTTTITAFAIIAIHISPSKAVDEMNNLTLAYDTFKRHWHTNDILIAGDFNADCNYLRADSWQHVTLRQDSRFTWLIGDSLDTTVANSDCSYDRFVVGGTALQGAVVPSSVAAYRFDDVMGLNKSEGLQISDHYPVELQLKGNPDTAFQHNIQTSTSFTVTDSKPVADINSIRAIYRSPSCAPAQFSVQLEREGTHMHYVSATVPHVLATGVVHELTQLNSACTGVLSMPIISTVEAYMKSNYLQDNGPNVYGLVTSPKSSYEVTVMCFLTTPNICRVTVTRSISGSE